MGTPLKWLLRSALTTITLALAAIIYLLVAVDPNDYKPQITNLAANQGLELSLDGDLAWQFFPQIGIKVERVDFAYSDAASGNIGQLTLAVNWGELFKLLDSSKIEPQLPMGTVMVVDSSIRIESLIPEAPVIELDNLNASVRNFSFQGESFPLTLSAEAAGGLPLSLSGELTLNSADNQLQKLSLENAVIKLDQLQLEGNIVTEDGFITAEGNLQGNNLNLKEQIGRLEPTLAALGLPPIQLPTMANDKALTDLDFDSSFGLNSNVISTITTSLTLDNQLFMVDTQVNHPRNNLYIGISGDSFKVADYVTADTTSSQNSALFAPLAAPFALWLGSSQLELSLGSLDFGDYLVSNIYLNLFGNQKVLRLSSLNADLFKGQLNANGRLDMRSAKPSFEFQHSLKDIDLQLALPALTDSSDISGLLSMNSSLQGTGNSGEELLATLGGSGQFTIANPSYLAVNAEQMFCNAAALFGGSSSKSNWPKGTQLEDMSGQFTLTNGKAQIKDLKTATGNLNISGRGTVQLLLKRYSITANTRVNGTTTSPSGCSVNKSLRNRNLPFICTGSYDVGGKTSCKPDDNLVRSFLKDNVFQKLGEQLFDSPFSSGEGSDSKKQDGTPAEEDPFKSLLRGVLEKNLK